MQPESNEEREAYDVRQIRRLVGFHDDYVDARLNVLMREANKQFQYYSGAAEYVRRVMQLPSIYGNK